MPGHGCSLPMHTAPVPHPGLPLGPPVTPLNLVVGQRSGGRCPWEVPLPSHHSEKGNDVKAYVSLIKVEVAVMQYIHTCAYHAMNQANNT